MEDRLDSYFADGDSGDEVFVEEDYLEEEIGILAVKFRALQDKLNKKPKIVHMLSTEHSNRCVDTGKKQKTAHRSSNRSASQTTTATWVASMSWTSS